MQNYNIKYKCLFSFNCQQKENWKIIIKKKRDDYKFYH